jgi:hypothetical protein
VRCLERLERRLARSEQDHEHRSFLDGIGHPERIARVPVAETVAELARRANALERVAGVVAPLDRRAEFALGASRAVDRDLGRLVVR